MTVLQKVVVITCLTLLKYPRCKHHISQMYGSLSIPKRSALFNGWNLPSHPTGGTMVQLHSSKTTCPANGKPLKLISGFCISTDSYFIFLSMGTCTAVVYKEKTVFFFIRMSTKKMCVFFCQALVFLAFSVPCFFSCPSLFAAQLGSSSLRMSTPFLWNAGWWAIDLEASCECARHLEAEFLEGWHRSQGENGVLFKFGVDLHPIHPQLGHLGNGIFLQHWRS